MFVDSFLAPKYGTKKGTCYEPAGSKLGRGNVTVSALLFLASGPGNESDNETSPPARVVWSVGSRLESQKS